MDWDGEQNIKKEPWLTEAALTDDDLPLMDENQSTEDLTTTSQASDSAIHSLTDSKKDIISSVSIQNMQNENDLSKMKANIDELDEFLIRNDGFDASTSGNDVGMITGDVKTEPDDGNDTDELLRMLGENDEKKKKVLIKTVKKNKITDKYDSTDDELEAGIKSYTIPKSAIIKKNDQLLKTHKLNKSSLIEPAILSNTTETKQSSRELPPKSLNKIARNKTIPMPNYSKSIIETFTHSTLKTYTPKHKQKLINDKAAHDTAAKDKAALDKAAHDTAAHDKAEHVKVKNEEDSCDEDIKGEEFLDEECIDLNDDIRSYGEVSDEELEKEVRRIPEKMDEEVPSDQESRDSELSLYMELPTSDSSDVDEWFELDIRNEVAADYLPILGNKAEFILNKENQSVNKNIDKLKQEIHHINRDIKMQVARIEDNRLKMIEIDSLINEK